MNEKLLAKDIRSAIKQGDGVRVRELLTVHPGALVWDTPFGSWLHVAASFGRADIVAYLISSGIDLNRKGGTFKGAAINEASSEGHLAVVKLLLDAGASLDVSEPERNPLFGAIYGGHMEIVKLLIQHGIDYRVCYTGESMKDMDAEAFARERGQTEIANYLAEVKSQ